MKSKSYPTSKDSTGSAAPAGAKMNYPMDGQAGKRIVGQYHQPQVGGQLNPEKRGSATSGSKRPYKG